MRMIQKCLLTQISRNVEAYMDDIMVKSWKDSDLLADLAETFANLRRYDIKLNPSKCTFGVPGGKLLGFLVSERGIDANPEKVNTILRMKSPGVHDVQKLTGCLAALSRFISGLGEKALPLYRLMKKSDKFEWTPEADAAFAELKPCFPPSRCLLRQSAKNLYCFILQPDRKSTRLNSSHTQKTRMPSSA